MLRLENISKTFKDKLIFQDANLEAEPGKLVLLMGESGAGKSTMLNIIAGMKTFNSGDYYFNGEKIISRNDEFMSSFRNKWIGYILQDFSLIEEYTVLENIVLPSYYQSQIERGTVQQKAIELAYKYKLQTVLNESVKNISGGQKQRVALVRSIILNPVIILADEPTSHLDADNFNLVIETFQELKKQKNILIIATHDERFREIADKIYRIKKYQLVVEKRSNK